MATRRFELVEGTSSKFWECAVEGSALTVRYGKIGTSGQSKTKEHASPAEASSELEQLVREKTKKGYLEVGAPAGGTDELVALRAHGEELLGIFGELTLLGEGEPCELATHFAGGLDGELWNRVFESVQWIADEADGGAVGFWTRDGARAVLYIDNEGQLRLTGATLIDHFAWTDHAGEHLELLRAFCAEHGLSGPRDEAEREAAVAGIETPEQRFAALKSPPIAKPATKTRAKTPAIEKGPRPLTTNLASCTLDDGRVLVVTGEDLGDGTLRNGLTFVIDPATLATRELAPLDLGSADRPEHLVPLAGGRALLLAPWQLFADDGWQAAPGEAIPGLYAGTIVHALRDGSFIVFGGSVEAHRVMPDGAVQRIGDLPEPRSYDGMVELPDGRLWFGGGEAQGATSRTVMLDPKSWTFTAGPDLPTRFPFRSAFFAGTGGRALVIGTFGDVVATSVWDGKEWSAPRPAPSLAVGASDFRVLSDGTIVTVRWNDGVVVTIDPDTLQERELEVDGLMQSGANAHEIAGGRVLFVGGKLYGNLPSEPQVWDRAADVATSLPGWEKDVARQAKALAQYREKEAKRREKEAAQRR